MTEENKPYEKLTLEFDIPLKEIESLIEMPINGDLTGYERIISPRELAEVKGMTFFREDVFQSLIRRIPLRSKSEGKIYPYLDSKIEILGSEPKGMNIGQTFILKDKVLSITEGLEKGIFEEFVTKGISKMPPAQIYGLDKQGRKALAFYIPPIVEIHKDRPALIDGIHRSYICRAAGTTIFAVHIYDVAVRLPFDPLTWKDAKLQDKRPPVEKRYKNLKRELFRDLGAVGIDG